MNKIEWYINRFKTMSIPEVGFRVGQMLQKRAEKGGKTGIDHTKNDYRQILTQLLTKEYPQVPAQLGTEFATYNTFNFFGTSLLINRDIDWHLDIMSGKRFPLVFAKDVDIRSGKFGSAKVVWEINRLQFMLPLLMKYQQTSNEADLALVIDLMKSWVKDNPYLQGVNWYSNIEVNIRLIVYYFMWQLIWQSPQAKTNQALIDFTETTWLPSIYEHCVYSHANPSKYSSANNHLISEYSGLFVAATLWPFKESDGWRTYAQKGLETEIVLQHSKNGVNKEEAAEYIQFITDFFLIPYAIGQKAGIGFSDNYKTYMFNIFNYIYHLLDKNGNYRKYGDEDDGKILITSTDGHFDNFSSILKSGAIIFNNADFKVSDIFDLKNYLLFGEKGKAAFESLKASKAPKKSMLLKDEGHFIFRKQDADTETYLHFDVAPLGFLSIAAHGHADALSYELHVDGIPFIVDPGTYTYHTSHDVRRYFLSTLAHNTISIDRANQAYQAGPTMWLKHYKTDVLNVTENNDLESVTGTHNGYKSLGFTHKRTIAFNKAQDAFEIDDEVTLGAGTHSVEMPFHLHPEVIVKKVSDNEYLLSHPKCKRNVVIKTDSQLAFKSVTGSEEPLLGWFSPSFLIKQPTTVLIGQLDGSGAKKIKTVLEVVPQ